MMMNQDVSVVQNEASSTPGRWLEKKQTNKDSTVFSLQEKKNKKNQRKSWKKRDNSPRTVLQ